MFNNLKARKTEYERPEMFVQYFTEDAILASGSANDNFVEGESGADREQWGGLL